MNKQIFSIIKIFIATLYCAFSIIFGQPRGWYSIYLFFIFGHAVQPCRILIPQAGIEPQSTLVKALSLNL